MSPPPLERWHCKTMIRFRVHLRQAQPVPPLVPPHLVHVHIGIPSLVEDFYARSRPVKWKDEKVQLMDVKKTR